MVPNATFNNIAVISWWSALLLEDSGGLGQNHRPVANVIEKCSMPRLDRGSNSQDQW